MRISSLGAEPQSLIKEGIEYIWCGDKAYWFRHAPVLFPMTGPTKDGRISVDGKTYTMPGNGFARDMEFSLENQSADTATFLLEDNEATHVFYPYHFALHVTYTLLPEGGYSAKATIDAKDTLYATFGWHPAFNLAINGKDASIDTYSLSFELEERLDRNYAVNGIFQCEKDFLVGDEITLSRTELDKGPIALHHVLSREITWVSSKGEHGITVTMGDMDTFVSWSVEKKNAPYVCLEPMYSFGDATRPQELKDMKECFMVKKGESRTFENEFKIF